MNKIAVRPSVGDMLPGFEMLASFEDGQNLLMFFPDEREAHSHAAYLLDRNVLTVGEARDGIRLWNLARRMTL